ncbi:YceI family protein [bacterium]|nr:YceI family protein [bacterium]MCI0601410.1 YceI family protein [bacterium]
MKKVSITSVGLLFLFVTTVFAADTFAPDKDHSQVTFTTQHLVISKVSGRFKEFDAVVAYDPKDISNSSLNGTIKTASLSTDNEKRDTHLKSPDFFDVQKYPEITFASKKTEKKGNEIWLTGDLTIRGVTKSISFPVTIVGPVKDPWGNSRLGVEASLKLNRQDFGVSWNSPLEGGGFVVGDEVVIKIDSELVQQVPKK